MKFCGHEGDSSWKECGPESFVGKRTQKCKIDNKKGVVAFRLTGCVGSA